VSKEKSKWLAGEMFWLFKSFKTAAVMRFGEIVINFGT
jgi:hypothetical protein